jgi:hypothetical protein
MGFNTGGLATEINRSMKEMNKIEVGKADSSQQLSLEQFDIMQTEKRKYHQEEETSFPKSFHLVISICFAFFLAFGSLIWFNLLAFMIVRFRQHINIKLLSKIIQSLGFLLTLLGVYFSYMAVRIFLK